MDPQLADVVTGALAPAGAQPQMINRDPPEVSADRAALVKRWAAAVTEAKTHWKADYKRMVNSMNFASGIQWRDQGSDDDRYLVNLTQRMIKTSVASMYAKNPTVVAKRRERLDFRIWDGKLETLQSAQLLMQNAAETGMPPPQEVMELLADVEQGVKDRAMMDKMGKTLEILARYYMEEQEPGFKLQMKQMVRRARTTGVGYVEIGFQREMELSDDETTRISDMTQRLAAIGRLQADLQDGELDPDAAEAEELRLAIAAMQAEPSQIVREGLVWTFPLSTKIIPSPETQKLIGWVGCPWLAKEIILTPERVKEVYGVDISTSFTGYKPEVGKVAKGQGAKQQKAGGKGLCCVWHIYDKSTGLEYVVCDGHDDFLKEPASPTVAVSQFFPVYAITFNEVEDEARLFPQSDVELIKHIQMEYNRVKEAKRQHRIANRPLYLAADGQFEEGEEESLAGHSAHDVIKVKALRDGVKVEDLIAPVKKVGVDPNLYETQELFTDMERVTGLQAANLGGTSDATATESSIGQNSMAGAVGLDGDDLDEMLTSIMRAAGEIMLMNLTAETVQEIAGVGAVWPTMSRIDIVKEIGLEVKAGSSGRPNQAEQAAKLQRIYPLLVQVPGISPRWLAELAISIADDDVDLADAIVDGLPSMVAQNAAAQAGAGGPPGGGAAGASPTKPGAGGAQNGPTPSAPGGTSQAGHPAAGSQAHA